MNESAKRIVELVTPGLAEIIHEQFKELVTEQELYPGTILEKLNRIPNGAACYTKVLPWDVVISLVQEERYDKLKCEAQRMARFAWATIALSVNPNGKRLSHPEDWPIGTVTISPLYVEDTSDGLAMCLYIRREFEGV